MKARLQQNIKPLMLIYISNDPTWRLNLKTGKAVSDILQEQKQN